MTYEKEIDDFVGWYIHEADDLEWVRFKIAFGDLWSEHSKVVFDDVIAAMTPVYQKRCDLGADPEATVKYILTTAWEKIKLWNTLKN